MDGILNVYKEPGFTSFDVVAKLRGICKQKKIGHTGTLDPDASGVLPVCLGNATRLCDLLTEKTKEYRAVMLLGCETDTQDTSGRVLSTHPVEADEAQIKSAILSFTGEYDQIPPMYSAIKIHGKKLCDLARAGREVERESRRVTIFSIRIEEISLPYVTMTVSCSKGTYIRTLCHDIGKRLGCLAAMDRLVRTCSGPFCLKEAHTLSQIQALADQGRLEEILMPTDRVLADLPAFTVGERFRGLADNGNPLPAESLTGQGEPPAFFTEEKIRIYREDGAFLGVYLWQEEKKRFRPVKFLGRKDN